MGTSQPPGCDLSLPQALEENLFLVSPGVWRLLMDLNL